MNQARALVKRGHSVTIFAGTRGFDRPPRWDGGVKLELFPVHQIVPGTGFAGLSAPSLLHTLKSRLDEFDVLHLHLARDLVVMPVGSFLSRRRRTYIVQTHGMVDPSHNPLAIPFDFLATRRVLRSATQRLYLTARESVDLHRVLGSDELQLTYLPNGVPTQDEVGTRSGTEVLYLARLQSRKQPAHFVEAAATLQREFPDAAFTLVGPDEGEADTVQSLIKRHNLESTVRWEGPLDASLTIERMKKSTIYVLPSVNEPFPMSVLEAMSLGLPVVVSDS